MSKRADLIGSLRRLATSLGKPTGQTVLLMQGVVTDHDGASDTVSIITQGGENEIDEWQYLLDGYSPTVGDVVWILDGGPGQKIVIGATNRP